MENKMSYEIGDAVKVEVYITPKISRIAVCKITNKYTRNNKNYYSIREANGNYMCSNIKEDRFITMETFGFDSEWVDTDLRVLKVFCDGDNGIFSVLIDTYGDVYDNFEDFKREHPFSSYKFGYVVFDTEHGYIPDSCNDWDDSPEEAMFDYEENCE